jgi:hypothetical protein
MFGIGYQSIVTSKMYKGMKSAKRVWRYKKRKGLLMVFVAFDV